MLQQKTKTRSIHSAHAITSPYFPYSPLLSLFPSSTSISYTSIGFCFICSQFFGSCFQFLRPYMTLSCTCFYASLLWVEVQCFLRLVFAHAVDTHLHFLASIQRAIRLCRDSCCASVLHPALQMTCIVPHRGNYCTSPAVHRYARWRTCTSHALSCLTGGGQMPGERTASGQSCESRHAFPYV